MNNIVKKKTLIAEQTVLCMWITFRSAIEQET